MDLLNLGSTLTVGGFSTLIPACVGVEYYLDMYDSQRKVIASSVAAVIGCGVVSAGYVVKDIGRDNNAQEIMGYVSSLSDEDLENLSEDLVETNISYTNIENKLSERIDLLSENDDKFSLDEQRELLQESVADYLEQLRYFDSEAYEEIIGLFSDGYDDGELEKSQLIKKMNL